MDTTQRKSELRRTLPVRTKPSITAQAGIRQDAPSFSTDILRALNLVLGPN